MNVNIPQALRNADITRYATRAAQLEKIEPVISYWCYYWIVNKILSKQLHLTDNETRAYTADLMDRLEKYRLELKDHETVTDDLVAQAYVEQFAMQAFQRADNAMIAKKATQQTADTFRAAATFFDLLGIWGTLSQDVSSRSKYAKHHALRIQKAMKAGEDPNVYNLPQSSEQTESSNGLPNVQNEQEATTSPYVGTDGSNAATQQGSDQENLTLSKDIPPTIQSEPQRLPRSPEPVVDDTQRNPPNSNYTQPFVEEDSPQVPSFTSEHIRYDMPNTLLEQGMPTFGETIPSSNVAETPNTQNSYQMPVSASTQASRLAAAKSIPEARYQTDDAAISDAQKHAKWAVSALNFEDVDTAVKELKIALNALGAS